MRRVLVIGPGGAGKTTLSSALSERTGIPVIHLDAYYWRPGWRPTPPAEWTRTVGDLVQRPAWIMDGNYGGTLEARIAAADTIVFLDAPRALCLLRLVWRRLTHHGRSRPSMPEGCPERLTFDFLRWVWTYPSRRRPRVLSRLRELDASRNVHVLRSRRDVAAFLAGPWAGAAEHDREGEPGD